LPAVGSTPQLSNQDVCHGRSCIIQWEYFIHNQKPFNFTTFTTFTTFFTEVGTRLTPAIIGFVTTVAKVAGMASGKTVIP
jgi:hypothetical protein